ncbi:23S rRNA (pseudouridine(1915)-N(3))-methyltransferase RlmH [Candidatus Woesearchaeota archaeon]|nr:23S rRNA (pseudouridine(1915)-N(3))-methyltransferase RlmH [Candidatus Woesearchaeota archaeon]
MIKILTIGKVKDRNIKILIEEFLKRLKKFYKVEFFELKNEEQILKQLKEGYIVACDENGLQLSSKEFSNFIKEKTIEKDLIFIVGDENGLSNNIKEKTNFLLSFSKMTFLHDMFKLILVEQIYRAFTIIKGMEYHK